MLRRSLFNFNRTWSKCGGFSSETDSKLNEIQSKSKALSSAERVSIVIQFQTQEICEWNSMKIWPSQQERIPLRIQFKLREFQFERPVKLEFDYKGNSLRVKGILNGNLRLWTECWRECFQIEWRSLETRIEFYQIWMELSLNYGKNSIKLDGIMKGILKHSIYIP